MSDEQRDEGREELWRRSSSSHERRPSYIIRNVEFDCHYIQRRYKAMTAEPVATRMMRFNGKGEHINRFLKENLPLFSYRGLTVETDRCYEREAYPDAQ